MFGDHTPRRLAISGTKSMTGHMMGAAGAFEAFATVKAVAEQCIPPTINYRDDDPEINLQIVTEPTPRRIRMRSRTTSASAGTTARSSSSATTATDRQRGPDERRHWPPLGRPLQSQRSDPRTEKRVPSPSSTADLARRAVVTGMGAVTPIGNTATDYWNALVAGTSGVAPITSFDATDYEVRIAAEVKGFDPTAAMDRKMARRMSRFIHFAMASSVEAIAAAGLDLSNATEDQRDRIGRGHQHGRRRARAGHRRDARPRREGPGPGLAVRDPGALGFDGRGAGLDALRDHGPGDDPGRGVREQRDRVPGRAAPDPDRRVRRGHRGRHRGGDPAGRRRRARQHGRALEAQRDPTRASRPFDRLRDGFVLGEGGGVAVVESAKHALDRGAPILAEIVGAALTADAFHISAPEPTGRGAAMAMKRAMAAAESPPATST